MRLCPLTPADGVKDVLVNTLGSHAYAESPLDANLIWSLELQPMKMPEVSTSISLGISTGFWQQSEVSSNIKSPRQQRKTRDVKNKLALEFKCYAYFTANSMEKRVQPKWSTPVQNVKDVVLPNLYFYNSLTSKKIIKRARQNYLIDEYMSKDLDLAVVIGDISKGIQVLYISSTFICLKTRSVALNGCNF
ncbi:unnamed protein product [Trichobilharzia regenti]|nr:unnamed protein product [Trichobilharzia regenti]